MVTLTNQIIQPIGKCLPFLRWAGGKKWLLKEIDAFIPVKGFNNYHEPFLGGGAIFFHLNPTNKSYLNDLNKELIDTYAAIKKNVDGVIKELKKYNNTEEFYYNIRDKDFVESKKKAARFIFLNQTSFNGIYRVNLKGKYNVPYGYRTKNFLEPENLRNVSKILKNTKLTSGDFLKCIDSISKDDLVFLDPPYTITHNNNGFFKYNKKLFSEIDQIRLSEFVDEVKRRGAYYILTNAAHLRIKEIFEKKGDFIYERGRASLIGGVNSKRGVYSEYIFTNVKPHK